MCSLKSTLAVGCFQGIVEQNNVDISSINPVVTRVINTEAYLGGQTWEIRTTLDLLLASVSSHGCQRKIFDCPLLAGVSLHVWWFSPYIWLFWPPCLLVKSLNILHIWWLMPLILIVIVVIPGCPFHSWLLTEQFWFEKMSEIQLEFLRPCQGTTGPQSFKVPIEVASAELLRLWAPWLSDALWGAQRWH